jgi:hypothetical protein
MLQRPVISGDKSADHHKKEAATSLPPPIPTQ